MNTYPLPQEILFCKMCQIHHHYYYKEIYLFYHFQLLADTSNNPTRQYQRLKHMLLHRTI